MDVRCQFGTLIHLCRAGLTFCLTGTLSMPKAKVEALIKANGGKVTAREADQIEPLTDCFDQDRGLGDWRCDARCGGRARHRQSGQSRRERYSTELSCRLLRPIGPDLAPVGLPVVKEAWLMASIDAGKPLTNKHMLTEDGGDDSEGALPVEQFLRRATSLDCAVPCLRREW